MIRKAYRFHRVPELEWKYYSYRKKFLYAVRYLMEGFHYFLKKSDKEHNAHYDDDTGRYGSAHEHEFHKQKYLILVNLKSIKPIPVVE